MNLTGFLISTSLIIPCIILARGIASSPLWSGMPKAEMQVCIRPLEISVTGHFEPADIARLNALAWQTKHALHTLRYIRYTDLEAECRLLAARLNESIGPDQLKRSYFTCIPRGGLIVLGILSYVLGLERWQLGVPPDPEAPLVVVDDCAQTGRRLHEFLEKSQSRMIIFSPLYSSPELRSAITKREPRVRACISARDLVQCGDFPEGDQRSFREISGSSDQSDYWHGLTEYLCFAWNEPGFVFLNPVTQKIDGIWTIFPHEVCMKNGPVRIPVRVLPERNTEVSVSENIVTFQDTGSVTIDNTATHDQFRVQGIAAEMWVALMELGTEDALLKKFLHEYDIDEVTLEEDISDFIQDLRSRNILKDE